MLTHVYADAAVPVGDADLLRVLVRAEKGLGRSCRGVCTGYDRLIGLRADGKIYRIVVSEDHAQTQAVYQVLTWFGCRRIEAELRPGIDDLFEMPSASSLGCGAADGHRLPGSGSEVGCADDGGDPQRSVSAKRSWKRVSCQRPAAG